MKCLLKKDIFNERGDFNKRVSEAYRRMDRGRDGSGSAWDIFVKVDGSCKHIKSTYKNLWWNHQSNKLECMLE